MASQTLFVEHRMMSMLLPVITADGSRSYRRSSVIILPLEPVGQAEA